ncbi:MAG: DMT family transporter [Bilophila wadsworthia]
MGFFLGLFSSATFGLIPLFTLPLIHDGVSPASVLFYRFLIASLTLGGVLVLRRERFHASAIDLCKLAGMSFMYTAAALLLFYGLNYMPSGVATTIQFLYPVMVMLLMIAFFHEQFSMITACSIVLAVAGVALLSIGGDSSRPVTLLGVGMMLLSGFCNALYITGIHVAGFRNMNGLVMTFYVLFFGAAFAFANAVGTGTFQPLSSWWEFMMAALLAVITAVLSNLTLVLAVQRIGSTLTSVLGVMEPLTAVFVVSSYSRTLYTLVGGVISSALPSPSSCSAGRFRPLPEIPEESGLGPQSDIPFKTRGGNPPFHCRTALANHIRNTRQQGFNSVKALGRGGWGGESFL